MGFWCPLCTLLTGLSPVFKSLLTVYFFKNSLLLVYNNLRIIGLFNTSLSCQNYHQCGVGLVVEHDLAKVETGVRFSYAAQNKERQRIYFVGVAHELLHVRGESNRGRETSYFELARNWFCDRFSQISAFSVVLFLRSS